MFLGLDFKIRGEPPHTDLIRETACLFCRNKIEKVHLCLLLQLKFKNRINTNL